MTICIEYRYTEDEIEILRFINAPHSQLSRTVRNDTIRYWHVCLCAYMHIYFTLLLARTPRMDDQETNTNIYRPSSMCVCVRMLDLFVCVYVCSSVHIFCLACFSPCIKLPVKCIANESKTWSNELIQCCAWNALWIFVKKKRHNSVFFSERRTLDVQPLLGEKILEWNFLWKSVE